MDRLKKAKHLMLENIFYSSIYKIMYFVMLTNKCRYILVKTNTKWILQRYMHVNKLINI